MDLSECGKLTETPDLSKATNLRYLDLSGCSSLRSFPQMSSSIKKLNLDDTAIEQIPCCVENFSRLTVLKMRGCKKLKNISPNIFRLKSLKQVDFTDCGGVITVLSDATVEKKRTRDEDEDNDNLWYGRKYFNFQNCFNLDGHARELILRSCFKSTMVLPGEEVPTYFKHRAYGNSLTVTLPQSSLSHKFLRFNACVVVEPLTDSYACMSVHFHFNGERYMHTVAEFMPLKCKSDHLVLFSFKFRPTCLPSKLDFNEVEFKFSYYKRIEECGIRLLNVSPYPDDSDGSSETEYNQQSGEKCDVVETESSMKRMRMTLGKSEEYFNLPCGQIVTDTGLTAPNLELPLGWGESSSVSSYPGLEGEALCVDSMITEQQDAQIPNAHTRDTTFSQASLDKMFAGRSSALIMGSREAAQSALSFYGGLEKRGSQSSSSLSLPRGYKCYKELDQMVIPVFYDVDPSHVRKQTGESGTVFEETYMGKPEDHKQKWRQPLADVANMAGEDIRHYNLERPSVRFSTSQRQIFLPLGHV